MTRVLSVHAPYGCQDRGVCCSSNWPIPVEAPALRAAEDAMSAGRLRLQRQAERGFVFVDGAPAETPAVLAIVGGACVFHRHSGDRRCEIHRVLGHTALPLACRQFPRTSLQDPRGTSVTLSHYCPTAAGLLESTSLAATIVTDARAFPDTVEYVGLDARTSLPPRLRPDMLMDWDSWWEWERLSVDAIGRAQDAAAGLQQLRVAVEHVRGWHPADGPLRDHIVAAFARPLSGDAAIPDTSLWHRREVLAAMPEDVRPASPAGPDGSAPPSTRAHQHYLAAHAFANWTAHLGAGLRTWLRSIEAAHALVTSGMGVSTADLWLRHLADPSALADGWSEAERD